MDSTAHAATTAESGDEIGMLRDSAAGFVRASTDHKRLRKLRSTLPGYDAALARQMAELGWFGILVPEQYSGLGLGFAAMAVVVQELGKGLLADPIVPVVVLAGQTLRRGENEALKERQLNGLAGGSLIPCVAWQEGLGGLDASAIETRADATAEGVRLAGRKRFVAGAGGATGFLVTAKSPHGYGIYWVEKDAPGLRLGFEWRADGTPSGVVELDGVLVPPANVLTAPSPQGLHGLECAIEQAAVMASAEMLGVMEAALQMTLEYMRNRVQFGKPIGSFQALQHKAVDLYVQQELARAVLSEAVQALDGGASGTECSMIASRCKCRSSDAGTRITREAIQLHGAIGFTDEYDVGLYLKRALVLSGWLGNASAHRHRFAALSAQHAEV